MRLALSLLALASLAAPAPAQVSPTLTFGNITLGGFVNIDVRNGRALLQIIRTRGMGTPTLVYAPGNGRTPSVQILPVHVMAIIDTHCPADGMSTVHYWDQLATDITHAFGPAVIYRPGRTGWFNQATPTGLWIPGGGPFPQEYWLNQCRWGYGWGWPPPYCSNPCSRDNNEPVASSVWFEVRLP